MERDGDLEEPGEREAARREERVQALALDELHREEARAPCLLDGEDRHDAGMVERRERTRLALESRQAFGVARDLLGQDLDRHVAPEPRIARAIDLAHPPRAQRRQDLVGAEPGSSRERHELGVILARAAPRQ